MNNNDLKFDSTLYVVPDKIQCGAGGVLLEWHIAEGSGDMIELIQPGCSCTAEVEILPDRVRAIYTDNTKETEVRQMPGHIKTISKNLRVFLKDGQPLKVRNERGVEAFNAQKASTTLFFHVNVFV